MNREVIVEVDGREYRVAVSLILPLIRRDSRRGLHFWMAIAVQLVAGMTVFRATNSYVLTFLFAAASALAMVPAAIDADVERSFNRWADEVERLTLIDRVRTAFKEAAHG